MANKSEPECSHSIMGYGIGNCPGCGQFPIVLYKILFKEWRCKECYKKETGNEPNNQVKA